MPWPVRSRLLFAENVNAPGALVERFSSVVPAGKTWLLKDIVFFNASGAANNWYLSMWTPTVQITLATFIGVASGSTGTTSGRSIVVPSGYKLGWRAYNNYATHVSVSGAQVG